MTDGYIEKSFEADKKDIELINQFTRTPFEPEMLYTFSVALCNNDIDRDYEKFSIGTLNQLKDMFIGRTGIFDHSMKSANQKARIYDTYIEKIDGKKTADNEDFYQLKAKAYMVKSDENLPLITEIEAGIKKEVSISCSVERSICSVCGRDKRQGGCEHISGREYNGKKAYTILDTASDAYEFSFVAVPAQREAGVTKMFKKLGKDFSMTDIIKSLKECSDDVVLTKSQALELAGKLEGMSEEAKLGREYKSALTKEVITLCSKAMPQMDLSAFSSVAQVMTTNELKAFKKAFSKTQYDNATKPQISAQVSTGNVNQFKI